LLLENEDRPGPSTGKRTCRIRPTSPAGSRPTSRATASSPATTAPLSSIVTAPRRGVPGVVFVHAPRTGEVGREPNQA